MTDTAGIVTRANRTSRQVLAVVAVACAATFYVEDWIAGIAIVVIWMAWKYAKDDTGLPVLAMALTFQWVQVTSGMWYHAATGRPLKTMMVSDYRPMMLIGLGCVAALVLGLRAGLSWIQRTRHGKVHASLASMPIGWTGLVFMYVAALGLQGTMGQLAYQFPDFTQAILTFKFLHLALLFLILRRLSRPKPQWHLIGAIMALEILLGITGFFAGYREPIVMAIIALFEVFNPRRVQQWVGVAVIGGALMALSVFWISVRSEYRKEFDNETFANSESVRIERMRQISSSWINDTHDVSEDMDALVDRMWVIYYPALAVARVPKVLPHTGGTIITGALQHVFSPRVFFPSKAELANDSDMVRRYSGLWVAGSDQNTSIAFGYAGESYIDFGVPWMFIPVFLYGLLAGIAYQELSARIHHEELRAGLLAVIFWLALYLFERSWVKTLGLTGTLLVYLGGPALLLDYYLSRARARAEDDVPPRTTEQWT